MLLASVGHHCLFQLDCHWQYGFHVVCIIWDESLASWQPWEKAQCSGGCRPEHIRTCPGELPLNLNGYHGTTYLLAQVGNTLKSSYETSY